MDFNTIFGAAVNGDSPFVGGETPPMDILSRSLVADAEEMARTRSMIYSAFGMESFGHMEENMPSAVFPTGLGLGAMTPEPMGYPSFTGFEDEEDPEAALSSGAFGTPSTKPEFNVEDSLRALLGRV